VYRAPYPLKGWDLWEYRQAVKRADAARGRLAAMTPEERMCVHYGEALVSAGVDLDECERRNERARRPTPCSSGPRAKPPPSCWVLDGWWNEDGGYIEEIIG